jgi:hypothetical protein
MFSMPNKTGSVPMRCLSSGLRFNFVYKANFHRLRPLSISDTTPCTVLRWATVRHFFSRFEKVHTHRYSELRSVVPRTGAYACHVYGEG